MPPFPSEMPTRRADVVWTCPLLLLLLPLPLLLPLLLLPLLLLQLLLLLLLLLLLPPLTRSRRASLLFPLR